MSAKWRDQRGQSVVEFAVIMPLLIVLILGVVDVSYALLDQHIVTKLTREGSNLISRDVTLEGAATALKSMSGRPVDFSKHSRVIFSVIRKGATTGTPNFGQNVLYRRYEYGTLSAASKLATKGGGSFDTGPDHEAVNADSDTGLQLTNLPPSLIVGTGSMVYVTEIFTKHEVITPLDRFGVKVPNLLYSIAYF